MGIKIKESTQAKMMKHVKNRTALFVGGTIDIDERSVALEREGYELVLYAKTGNMRKAVDKLLEAGGGRDNRTNRSPQQECWGYVFTAIKCTEDSVSDDSVSDDSDSDDSGSRSRSNSIIIKESTQAIMMEHVENGTALFVGGTIDIDERSFALQREGYEMVLYAKTENIRKAVDKLLDAGGGRDNRTNRSPQQECWGYVFTTINCSDDSDSE